MARIYTIANNKGGCGKTTTAANLAAALWGRGFDVLAVDADAQANLTACLGCKDVPPGVSTFDALKAEITPYIEPLRLRIGAGPSGSVLDLLPGSPDLAAVEAGLAVEADRLQRLGNVLSKYSHRYDAIIVDTPPAVGVLTLSALYCADAVIIAVQPQFLAVQGLVTLAGIVQRLNSAGARIQDSRVLFTQYDRRKSLHRLSADKVQGAGFPVFASRIRENVALGEAPAAGLDVFQYAPKSNGAADYTDFCAELLRLWPLAHVKHSRKQTKQPK